MFLNVGLDNGLLNRYVVDSVTGDISDVRHRVVGSKPVKLFKIKLRKQNCVLALSSSNWIGYYFQSKYIMTPIS